jgi:hypothetical protein
VTESVPRLVELPRPRALTEAEHALMARLVTFGDVPNLREQVATVRVASTCDCGCASVGLLTEGPQVPAMAVARLSDTGREDYFAVSASGGGDVSVVLHVLSGVRRRAGDLRGRGRTGGRATRRHCDQHLDRVMSALPLGIDDAGNDISCTQGHSAANSTSDIRKSPRTARYPASRRGDQVGVCSF